MMKDSTRLTFPAFFSNTLSQFSQRDAMALVGEKPLTYAEVNDRIQALIRFLEQLGVVPGDKVAILSSNQPNWGITYFAITFMGAVVVPLLPEFLPAEIEMLLDHSETKIVFASEHLIPKVEKVTTKYLWSVVKIEDFSLLKPEKLSPVFNVNNHPEKTYNVEEDDLAAIIYTSGTTGKPKGVMLTHRNICFVAVDGHKIQYINETDRFLSILPLSHTYENTLGLILPMYRGACIYYLTKPPTPSILLPALLKVRPTTMLTVPLIMEKIYRSKILPAFTENITMRLLYKIPPMRKLLHRIAGKKLMETFGGELTFFGIGGAKVNKTVERFLIEAKFPYAVGYGLTECAPLLAGFNPQHPRLQSTGPACEGLELKIHHSDKRTGEGEIWAKGPSIMKGYYKEPELTREIINAEGWLRTGDLGVFDDKGNLFIKGRAKSMIVRSNGENIYPEDIESVINNFHHVSESLVVEQKGKLIALVHFNTEEIELRYQYLKSEVSNYVDQKIEELLAELQEYVNSRVNKYQQVQMVIAQPDPFQKTATQKIKRFLYT
ncbi:MAG: AMP-binding protein [Bacteroidales bacterium]|nr:AMP-binding protein [Bacteroidales bacterium]MDD4604501.1 AMP-binding protein [Bacteroidales bacterium]